jgi:hypothetical protein
MGGRGDLPAFKFACCCAQDRRRSRAAGPWAAGDAPITTDAYEAADRKKTVLPEELELRIQQHSEGSVGSVFNLLHLQKPLAVAVWETRRRK